MSHKTENAYFKSFAKYTSLNVTGMLGLSLYILADTFFIARGMGADGLAALNFAIPVYSLIHGAGLMLGMGGAAKFSVQRVRGRADAGNKTFTAALALAAVLFAVLIPAGIFLPENIAALLGAEGNVLTMTAVYLRMILLFTPAFLLNNILLAFVRCDGAPALSMAAMLSGSLMNILLDWIFIFPCGMGIFGAVLATCLAPIISMSVLLPHFILRRNSFRTTKSLPRLNTAAAVLSLGVPSLVTELSSGLVIVVYNAVFLRLLGNTGVAAYGVIANIALVVTSVYTGIAQGIQPVESRCHALGDIRGSRAVMRYALITSLIFSAAVCICTAAFAPQITACFNSEANVRLQEIAEQGLRIYFIGCPLAGFNIIASIFFTSAEKARPAQIISMLRGLLIILPAILLLSLTGRSEAVWCAYAIAEAVTAVYAAAALRRL